MGGVKKLSRFPIRHPDASVRGSHAGQVALVQSVAWREFEKVGHRSAREVRMRRSAVTSAIYVGLHHVAGIINVVTVNIGAMIFVLTNDLKPANGRAVSFTTTGYARRRSSMAAAV